MKVFEKSAVQSTLPINLKNECDEIWKTLTTNLKTAQNVLEKLEQHTDCRLFEAALALLKG